MSTQHGLKLNKTCECRSTVQQSERQKSLHLKHVGLMHAILLQGQLLTIWGLVY